MLVIFSVSLVFLEKYPLIFSVAVLELEGDFARSFIGVVEIFAFILLLPLLGEVRPVVPSAGLDDRDPDFEEEEDEDDILFDIDVEVLVAFPFPCPICLPEAPFGGDSVSFPLLFRSSSVRG